MQALLREAKDPLANWLDEKKGYTIIEHSIFNKLSQQWEAKFHKDMDALNVRFKCFLNVSIFLFLFKTNLIYNFFSLF